MVLIEVGGLSQFKANTHDAALSSFTSNSLSTAEEKVRNSRWLVHFVEK